MYRNDDIDYLKYLKGKKVIIFGAGKLGKKIFHILSENVENIKIIAFCDNDEKKQNLKFMEIPVISFETLCEINSPDILIVISCYEREIKQQLLNRNIYNYISASQIDWGVVKIIMTNIILNGKKSWGYLAEKLVRKCFSHI